MSNRDVSTVIFAAASALLQPLVMNSAMAANDGPAMIVLVRHGETGQGPGNEPILTAAGHERAKELSAALRNVKFSAIVTTHLIRTHETAQPLATTQGLTRTVVHFDPSKSADYVNAAKEEIRKHAGGAVLVVGHQRSIPALIAAYGGPQLPIICENRFGNMFVLIPADGGKAYLVHSHYGASSPPPGADCI
jgi:broad specificity phosphatase PhoE